MRSKAIAIFTAALIASAMVSCGDSSSRETKTVKAKRVETTTAAVSETSAEIVTEPEVQKTEENAENDQERTDAEAIRQSINDGDYQQAYNALSAFEKAYGKDTAYTDLKKMLQNKVLDDIHANIDEKLANGSIIAAVEYVRDEKGVYSGLEEVQALYDELVETYVDSIIEQAKTAVNDGDFDGASELINVAKTNVGSDNERLKSFEEKLSECQPVYLFDLNLFNYSGEKPVFALSTLWKGNSLGKPLLSYEHHMDRSQQKIMDSAGNEYKYYYYVGSALANTKGECFGEYLINGKYDTFSGVVAFPDDEYGVSGPSQFVVYGDGEELYRSPIMDRGSLPEPFSVDIKGVDVFRIQFYPQRTKNDGTIYGTNGAATIFDGTFNVTPKFD